MCSFILSSYSSFSKSSLASAKAEDIEDFLDDDGFSCLVVRSKRRLEGMPKFFTAMQNTALLLRA